MTYVRTRRAQRRTELDREAWATYDKLSLSTQLEGSGEAQVTVYFGQAFENAPYFTHSAAASSDDVAFPEGNGSVFLHKDLAGAGPVSFGASPVHDHRTQGGWLGDPSFELQGAWGDTYIPTWYEDDLTVTTRAGWASYQKVAEENAYEGPNSTYGNDNVNHWVQEGGRSNRWSLTTEDHFRDASAERYEGAWSAKYVFDGAESRWLVPISSSDLSWGYPHVVGITDIQVTPHNWNIHEWDLTSYVLPRSSVSSALPYGVWDGPVGNPRMATYRHIVHAKSDAALTCEMQVHWLSGQVTAASEFAEYLVDDRYNLAVMSTDTATFEMVPGEWNELTFDWEYPGWMQNPLVPWRGEARPNALAGQINHAMFRFRFTGGTPSQVVYADEIYAHPVLQTLPALPLLTAGVESWIRDDNGFYVGANLWFKTKSATGGVLS